MKSESWLAEVPVEINNGTQIGAQLQGLTDTCVWSTTRDDWQCHC